LEVRGITGSVSCLVVLSISTTLANVLISISLSADTAEDPQSLSLVTAAAMTQPTAKLFKGLNN
jgi:hypothetical protein